MKFNPQIHRRRSIRLRDYDYATAGAYFVTVCVQGRDCLFGEVVGGEMVLNVIGRVVGKWWQTVPGHFPQTQTDEFIIMPNHFHAIVWIVGAGSPRPGSAATEPWVGAGSPRPILSNNPGGETPNNPGGETPNNPGGETPNNPGGETPPLRATLGQIIGYFKYQSTKEVNEIRNNPGVPVWQRNYHERIIRDDEELTAIRTYIRDNPRRWQEDPDNPANLP